MTTHNVKRYLQLEEPTILGHMDQQRQGTRSTTRKAIPTNPPENQDTNNASNDHDLHPNEMAHTRTHATYLSIQDLPTGRVYTDQTGAFPVVSSQGIKALMVMYDYDSNAILTEGLTSRGKIELLRVQIIITTLTGRRAQT